MKVKIIEVGARDGLQNESKKLSVETRLKLIIKLTQAGLKHIEVGAFVSPKWVPQMQGTDKIVKKVLNLKKTKKISSSLKPSVLVPNLIGMEKAVESGIKEVAIFGACSEKFSKNNINCSIADSFKRFQQVVEVAEKKRIKVRGYLSTAFGCPYEGKVSQAKVIKLTKKMFDLGVYEVSIGDTIGVATPRQVESLLQKLKNEVDLSKIALHFHDTRGTALANVLMGYQLGIRSFDSSVGGLGGCPYAKGASGNLATEDLVYMLQGMGIKTGVDLKKLVQIRNWVEKEVGRKLPSHVGLSGIPNPPIN